MTLSDLKLRNLCNGLFTQVLWYCDIWVNLGLLVGCSLGHAPSWYQQDPKTHKNVGGIEKEWGRRSLDPKGQCIGLNRRGEGEGEGGRRKFEELLSGIGGQTGREAFHNVGYS